MFGNVYRGRNIWVSGHTGFKGSWLVEWLLLLGARVHGFALTPPSGEPALFDDLGLAERLAGHVQADVRDLGAVREALGAADPDFVFHLAAQPLVQASYRLPVETWATNVLGTVHVLEALRGLDRRCAAVIVTTDKCYEDRPGRHGYREGDRLGGHDPYAASKAAAELAVASFRASFSADSPQVRIASARAGNVLGGGDWAADRLVPDCVRALRAGRPIVIRSPAAVRPWQHVLEPLAGYLWLGAALYCPSLVRVPPPALASAFNFGPGPGSHRRVDELVAEVTRHWPGKVTCHPAPEAGHETAHLHLCADKAHALLGWTPTWDFATTVERTIWWYRQREENGKPSAAQLRTAAQIREYAAQAGTAKQPWALAAFPTSG